MQSNSLRLRVWAVRLFPSTGSGVKIPSVMIQDCHMKMKVNDAIRLIEGDE
jgi:hypothetical protein